MERLEVDPSSPDPNAIARAAAVLASGGLVAFPTETVYGLGAHALDRAAVERIYAAKGRPSYNPLIVHVATAADVHRVAREWNGRADALAAAFWPGPLTLVVPKRAEVPDAATAGLPSVAVRVPSHPVAHALLVAANIPVAAPSANRSMLLSPTTAHHVAKSLGDSVDVLLDAGPTGVGIESTVVDVSGDIAVLLRPGTITLPELERVIGEIRLPAHVRDGVARASPGMLDRHYAPRAALSLVASHEVHAVIEAARRNGAKIGAMVFGARGGDPLVITMPREPLAYASRLYATLHDLDDLGCDEIVVERVPETVEWLGVRDRLERAAR